MGYEGGRGDRNDWQGSFHIELSADNRWREERLGAPWPSNPTDVQCLVPGRDSVLGKFPTTLVLEELLPCTPFARTSMIKFMVLSDPLMDSLRVGVSTPPLVSMVTDTTAMDAAVLISSVLCLTVRSAVSTGGDVWLDRTLKPLSKRSSPELPSTLTWMIASALALVS